MKFRFLGLYIGFSFCASFAYANGFYVGAGGGYDVTDFYKTLNIVQNNTVQYDKEDDLAGEGFFGNILTGYEFDIGSVFIAAQLDGNLSSVKYNGWYVDNENNEYSTATFTIHKSYGISILPGYYFNHNVGLYGRAGFERGDFTYSEYKSDANGNNYDGISESKWLNGLLLGLGTSVPLSQHTAIRFEYDHIWYETFTDTQFPMAGRTINIRPNSNLVQLSLIYKF